MNKFDKQKEMMYRLYPKFGVNETKYKINIHNTRLYAFWGDYNPKYTRQEVKWDDHLRMPKMYKYGARDGMKLPKRPKIWTLRGKVRVTPT